jgi:hypothetical protein
MPDDHGRAARRGERDRSNGCQRTRARDGPKVGADIALNVAEKPDALVSYASQGIFRHDVRVLGYPRALLGALDVTRPLGAIVLVGLGGEATLPMNSVVPPSDGGIWSRSSTAIGRALDRDLGANLQAATDMARFHHDQVANQVDLESQLFNIIGGPPKAMAHNAVTSNGGSVGGFQAIMFTADPNAAQAAGGPGNACNGPAASKNPTVRCNQSKDSIGAAPTTARMVLRLDIELAWWMGVEAVPEATKLQPLIQTVRTDRTKKALLSDAVMSGDVWVIPDLRSPSLRLLFFDQPERSFIPVFSDRKTFDQEAYGTGFEGKAITISAAQFSALLEGDELVILNPGHRPAIEFQASELKKAVTMSRY